MSSAGRLEVVGKSVSIQKAVQHEEAYDEKLVMLPACFAAMTMHQEELERDSERVG